MQAVLVLTATEQKVIQAAFSVLKTEAEILFRLKKIFAFRLKMQKKSSEKNLKTENTSLIFRILQIPTATSKAFIKNGMKRFPVKIL